MAIEKYLYFAQTAIDHYKSLGRDINWAFNGGEPLEMFDFPMLLKLCKDNGGTIDLTTNGGKLWMDWWAIEPHIDTLHLSYHYWQNPKLINFIIEIFQKKNKSIDVMVPIRPDFFDEDLDRALEIESKYKFIVSKTVLYTMADPIAGMFPYTAQQLRIIRGEELVQEQQHYIDTTFQDRYEERIENNPVYTGMWCNAGIECLSISHQGWASGSHCNDKPLGNIWSNQFVLPTSPHVCGMQACISSSDQAITKFKFNKVERVK
jgi:MoaA/NifB/PqqE/SkfB family radical SAM enzyme